MFALRSLLAEASKRAPWLDEDCVLEHAAKAMALAHSTHK
jgi:hypothetical protein